MIPHIDPLRERGGWGAGYGVGQGVGWPTTGLAVVQVLVDEREVVDEEDDGAGVAGVGVTTASGRGRTETWTFTGRLVVVVPLGSLKTSPEGASRVIAEVWSAVRPAREAWVVGISSIPLCRLS